MDLSIIIVSFNTKEVTRNCLNSILNAQWRSSYEIIIVDNNSQDGSVEMIREEFKMVKLIANSDNRLFSIANNQGAAIASGRWLFLLNSDTLIYDDQIQRLLDYADSLPEDVVCVGPKVLNADKTLQSQGCFGSSHYDMFVKHFKVDRLLPAFLGKLVLPPATYRWNTNIPHEVGWVVGAAMLMRTETYLKIGGLNEQLEFYGEEPEFGYRSKKLGYKTIYYPDANLIHLGGVSTKKSAKKDWDVDLRRYLKIVEQTYGYNYASGTSRITKLAYQLKYFVTRNPKILELIKGEQRVIDYFKQVIREAK